VPWHGDVTDLKQRGFVLVYAALAVWTAVVLADLFQRLAAPRAVSAALLVITAIAVVAVPIRFASSLGAPRLAWSGSFFDAAIDRNLIAVADYLRRSAAGPDVMAIAHPVADEMLTEDITRISALSGLPVYLSRAGVLSVQNPRIAAVVRERFAALDRIDQEVDPATALAEIRNLGIRWFVVDAEHPPRWGAPEGSAAFKAGRWLVYRTDP
jgi:hypothetical protein